MSHPGLVAERFQAGKAMYWFDATIGGGHVQSASCHATPTNTVYLFGKGVESNQTTCWKITNVPFRIWFKFAGTALPDKGTLARFQTDIEQNVRKWARGLSMTWTQCKKRRCPHISAPVDQSAALVLHTSSTQLEDYVCADIHGGTLPFSALESLQALCLTGQYKNRMQVYVSPSDLRQRMLILKEIRGPSWLTDASLMETMKTVPIADRFSTCTTEYECDFRNLLPVPEDQVPEYYKLGVHLNILIISLGTRNFNAYAQNIAVPKQDVELTHCSFVHYNWFPFNPASCGYVSKNTDGHNVHRDYILRSSDDEAYGVQQDDTDAGINRTKRVHTALSKEVKDHDVIIAYGLFDDLIPALTHASMDLSVFSRVNTNTLSGHLSVPVSNRFRHYQNMFHGRVLCDAYMLVKSLGLYEKHITCELADLATDTYGQFHLEHGGSFPEKWPTNARIDRESTASHQYVQIKELHKNKAVTVFRLLTDKQILYTLFYLSNRTGAPLKDSMSLSSVVTNSWWLTHAFYSRDYVFHAMFFTDTFYTQKLQALNGTTKVHASVAIQKAQTKSNVSDAAPELEQMRIFEHGKQGATTLSTEESVLLNTGGGTSERNEDDERTNTDENNDDEDTDVFDEGRGGLVLDPKIGVHENVSVLDFQAMYISLIMALNLCWSTLSATDLRSTFSSSQVSLDRLRETVDDFSVDPEIAAKQQRVADLGVLPRELYDITKERLRLKRLAKDMPAGFEREACLAKVKALKLQSNSVYGCIYMSMKKALKCVFKFNSIYIGETITSFGRNVLNSAEQLVPMLIGTCIVIYGDTDSLMIKNTVSAPGTYKKASELAAEAQVLARGINALLPGLQITEDAYYSVIVLIKPKCYAAIPCTVMEAQTIHNATPPVAGSILSEAGRVRNQFADNDFHLIFKQCGREQGSLARILLQTRTKILLDVLCHHRTKDLLQIKILRRMRAALHQLSCGKVYLHDLVIVASLEKNSMLSDYVLQASSMQNKHVHAARISNTFGAFVRQGQSIPYVMCQSPVHVDVPLHPYPPNLLWPVHMNSVDLGTVAHYTPLLHPAIPWYREHLKRGVLNVLPAAIFDSSLLTQIEKM